MQFCRGGETMALKDAMGKFQAETSCCGGNIQGGFFGLLALKDPEVPSGKLT